MSSMIGSDRTIVRLTLYGEARNQPVMAMIGVLWVIRNRRTLGHWGPKYSDVCLAPYQFSCWNENNPNRVILKKYLDLYEKGLPLPYDPPLDVCGFLVDKLLQGVLKDPTMGATHYYATSLDPAPHWSKPPAHRTTILGAHAFYTDVKV
jgi:N-acetylmuramoyl-L-alanine amidase